ncbi:MAG: nicotinamide mononucleotide transporter [Bacteroidetes bacterium]|nr:nicotinamide mononucleotide transporter [Bacteroidota bacterium]
MILPAELLNASTIAIEWRGYAMSYLELVGCIAGMICVIYAIQFNILTWLAACINIFCFCILFYQVQLYADMILQIFFLVFSIYGWYKWQGQAINIKPREVHKSEWPLYITSIIFIGIALYYFITHLHILFPIIFTKPASYAIIDSIIASMSIIATIMMARRQIDNWILWIIINALSVFLYFKKSVYLISIEYFIFLILGFVGYYQWRREMKI